MYNMTTDDMHYIQHFRNDLVKGKPIVRKLNKITWKMIQYEISYSKRIFNYNCNYDSVFLK